ncbi:MAG: type II CRISPR RNA-guided endonuclease Cas9, partial [Gudongella sp.]|nr:type II CRISPR RNA-guided endonuclease Cas9 [Gudongella sp.]
KISQFEAHASDLKLLKSVLRRFSDPQTYKEVFKSEEKECNYSAYSGNHKSTSAVKSCNQEDFCKYIKGILKESFKDPLFESGEYYDMKCRLDEGTFMPKQTSKENSLIPNQLHKRELESILHNASKHYPFLCEADESGLTVMDKIMSLCTFRIPYYVGPLGQGSKNNWAVRREEGRVTPWNFEDKIDLDESAVKFIDRLINMCSYLPGEKVIPKSSILYSRFELFNELNTMRINGERISVELKKDIVRDLFENPQNNRKVTKKSIIGYLMRRGLSDGETEISGVDDTIKSSLRSESDMRRILGEGFDRRLADDVIRAIVVFGDDRSRLRKKLETDYSDRLTRDQLDSLSRLQYKDWGRLSERFLTGVRSNIQGVEMNILTALEQTNLNLNEILSDRYGFKKEVDRIRDEQSDSYDGRITYGLVEDLYVSPPVRRGIWRSLRIIEDILKITGHPPAKVFIETTRESGEKTRTVSRKDSLQKLFKSCKEEEWLKRLEGETDGRLRSKKYYSYYTQHGRCMYCGSGIDLNSLGDSNACDMDHIHPRSKKTDDSIHNNMVLVCRECNQRKGDAYPLPQEWQDRMRPFWKHLFENGFITKEKYGRLTRNHGFTEDELSGFIARQIVETSQTVKEVAGVLKKVFGDGTEIVYVKGNAISEFRRNNGFVKCRIVNDYHHAKDAYLNIVIGNAYNVKFTHDPRTFVRSGKDYTLNQERMLRYDIERGGERAWTAGEDGTISVVRKHMRRNNIRFTRFAFEEKGQLFDVNPVKAPKGQHPLKKGLDIDRYGGYNKISGSYFALVEHGKVNERIRTLQPVPVLLMNKKENGEAISEYLSKECNLEEPRVLIPRILTKSVFEIDGFRLHITGRTGNNITYTCAEQLILDYDSYDYCKNIYNHTTKSKESRKTL